MYTKLACRGISKLPVARWLWDLHVRPVISLAHMARYLADSSQLVPLPLLWEYGLLDRLKEHTACSPALPISIRAESAKLNQCLIRNAPRALALEIMQGTSISLIIAHRLRQSSQPWRSFQGTRAISMPQLFFRLAAVELNHLGLLATDMDQKHLISNLIGDSIVGHFE